MSNINQKTPNLISNDISNLLRLQPNNSNVPLNYKINKPSLKQPQMQPQMQSQMQHQPMQENETSMRNDKIREINALQNKLKKDELLKFQRLKQLKKYMRRKKQNN